MRLFYLISFFLFFFSCTEDLKEKQPIETQPTIAKAEIDSTEYYYSLFAPNAFKIDTFFQRRFSEKTFNGTILFAKGNHKILQKAYGFSTL